MTRAMSPVEVRFVGDRELAAIVAALVEPADDALLSIGRVRAAAHDVGAWIDLSRLEMALERAGLPREERRVVGHGVLRGRFLARLRLPTGHERLRIATARREDEADAALPQPVPTSPAESVSATIERLLG